MQKVIIFDMDGVLFDSSDVVFRGMCRKWPGLTREMSRDMLCGNVHDAVEKITIPKNIETEEEAERRRARYTEEKSSVPLFPGVFDLLQDLHQKGCILALNTSASDRTCHPPLERAGVLNFFDFVGTKEVSKSKVEKFGIIKEKYGLVLKDMLFVTDTLGDLREAKMANVPTIAVTYGVHGKEFFTRESHKNLIAIVESVVSLRNCIEGRMQ